MNIVKITDGLGNQMFQYAFALWVKNVTHKKVFLDTRFINNEDEKNIYGSSYLNNKNDVRKYSLDRFNISLQSGEQKLLTCARRIFRYIDEDNRHIDCSRFFPSYYKGYFFNQKYFCENREELLREFTLKDKIIWNDEIIERLLRENTISIHVRRGDFIKLGRDISETTYYVRALDYMNSNISNPLYLVFSNDIEWVKMNMNMPDGTIYVSEMGYEDYEELEIMRQCKNHIIANSTFSYWGAYLCENPEKTVVCPKRWKTAIIPTEWIKL